VLEGKRQLRICVVSQSGERLNGIPVTYEWESLGAGGSVSGGVTDSAGIVIIESLVANGIPDVGVVRVRAGDLSSASGFCCTDIDLQEYMGETIVLILQPGVMLPGVVLDSDLNGLTEVMVRAVLLGTGLTATGETTDKGRFVLNVGQGTWGVEAIADGGSAYKEIHVGGDGSSMVELVIDRTAGISGRVINRFELPLRLVPVMIRSQDMTATDVTNRYGRFSFRVKEGMYTVSAAVAEKGAEIAEIRSGNHEIVIKVDVGGSMIDGRVIRSNGTPVRGACLRCFSVQSNAYVESLQECFKLERTDESGDFHMYQVRPGDIIVTAFAEHMPFAMSSRINIREDENVSMVEVKEIDGAMCTIELFQPGGGVASGVDMLLRGEMIPPVECIGKSDVHGRWMVGKLPHGKYTLMGRHASADIVYSATIEVNGIEASTTSVTGSTRKL
jgi:hypothetical protein